MRNKVVDTLEWNVFVEINDKIETRNIFNLSIRFIEYFEKALKYYKKHKSFDVFIEDVNIALMYAYWAKSEYEVVIDHWIGKSEGIKVDIYEQVKINWNRFVEYLESKLALKKQ